MEDASGATQTAPLIPRTRLIGRAAEIAAARTFLVEDALPLLTLTGPGGVGKSLPFEDAMAEVLAPKAAHLTTVATERVLRPEPAATTVTFTLTRREREILGLLCQRYTDPEIADRLTISPRTASRHVANIFNKLGVSSRRDAAALAVARGLL